MQTEFEQIFDSQIGNLLQISNSDLQVCLSMDFGPRIMSIKFRGSDNLLFVDTNNSIAKDVFAERWFLRGGHRFWTAPEDNFSYLPDNCPPKITIKDNKAFCLASNALNGLQFDMIVSVKNNILTIDHVLTNASDTIVTKSLWGITTFPPTGKAFFHSRPAESEFLPAHKLVFWKYSKLRDPRLVICDQQISVVADKNLVQPFKIGGFSPLAKVSIVIGETKIEKSFPFSDLQHADFDCNVEIYTNDKILEAETLSPLYQILPKQSKKHTETWTFLNKEQCDD